MNSTQQHQQSSGHDSHHQLNQHSIYQAIRQQQSGLIGSQYWNDNGRRVIGSDKDAKGNTNNNRPLLNNQSLIPPFNLPPSFTSTSTSTSGPLTPQSLLSRMLSLNLTPLKCNPPPSPLPLQEHNLLVQLVASYREEIRTKERELAEMELMIGERDKLAMEVEMVVRSQGDHNQNYSLPIQHSSLVSDELSLAIQIQLSEIQRQNGKLQAKLRQMRDYCLRLRYQNERLEIQKKASRDIMSHMEADKIDRHQHQQGYNISTGNYLEYLEQVKLAGMSHQSNLLARMRQKEQEALRSIEEQEMEMRERNRIRKEGWTRKQTNRQGRSENARLYNQGRGHTLEQRQHVKINNDNHISASPSSIFNLSSSFVPPRYGLSNRYGSMANLKVRDTMLPEGVRMSSNRAMGSGLNNGRNNQFIRIEEMSQARENYQNSHRDHYDGINNNNNAQYGQQPNPQFNQQNNHQARNYSNGIPLESRESLSRK